MRDTGDTIRDCELLEKAMFYSSLDSQRLSHHQCPVSVCGLTKGMSEGMSERALQRSRVWKEVAGFGHQGMLPGRG